MSDNSGPKVTVVATTSKNAFVRTQPPASGFFFLKSDASDAIEVASGDAAVLDALKEELEGGRRATSTTARPVGTRRELPRRARPTRRPSPRRQIAYTGGIGPSFDGYNDEDVVTNFGERLGRGRRCRGGGPGGISGRMPTSRGSVSSSADEAARGDDVLPGRARTDEYELDASLDNESERTRAALTVQTPSTIERSRLSATAQQLSSPKNRNNDLIHVRLETTKGRGRGRLVIVAMDEVDLIVVVTVERVNNG